MKCVRWGAPRSATGRSRGHAGVRRRRCRSVDATAALGPWLSTAPPRSLRLLVSPAASPPSSPLRTNPRFYSLKIKNTDASATINSITVDDITIAVNLPAGGDAHHRILRRNGPSSSATFQPGFTRGEYEYCRIIMMKVAMHRLEGHWW